MDVVGSYGHKMIQPGHCNPIAPITGHDHNDLDDDNTNDNNDEEHCNCHGVKLESYLHCYLPTSIHSSEA